MPTRARNPDQHGSCCSRFLFRYANDLVAKGFEGEVKEADVWDVHADDEPAIILGAFAPVWEEEQKRPDASLIVALRRFLFTRYVACVGTRAESIRPALKFGRLTSLSHSHFPP